MGGPPEQTPGNGCQVASHLASLNSFINETRFFSDEASGISLFGETVRQLLLSISMDGIGDLVSCNARSSRS